MRVTGIHGEPSGVRDEFSPENGSIRSFIPGEDCEDYTNMPKFYQHNSPGDRGSGTRASEQPF
jgi:hypothetical protein